MTSVYRLIAVIREHGLITGTLKDDDFPITFLQCVGARFCIFPATLPIRDLWRIRASRARRVILEMDFWDREKINDACRVF